MNGQLTVAVCVVIASTAGMSSRAEAADVACIDQCRECEKLCLMCATECLNELSEGKSDRKACIKACLDCADICGLCARLASRNGTIDPALAALCVKACEKCALECEKHKDDETCRACAEQCRKCAKECREHVSP